MLLIGRPVFERMLPGLLDLASGNFLYLGIIMIPGEGINAGKARAVEIAGLNAGLRLQIVIPILINSVREVATVHGPGTALRTTCVQNP